MPPEDSRITAMEVGVPGGPRGYLARPTETSGALPGLVVVHENRGLNQHIQDVARRAALQGFVALAPDS